MVCFFTLFFLLFCLSLSQFYIVCPCDGQTQQIRIIHNTYNYVAPHLPWPTANDHVIMLL